MEQIEVNVPKGWSWKKFEDVCVLKRGYDLPTHARSVGNIPLYSANGVTDYIDQFKVEGPGVVTGRSGTIGKVHFVESDYWPLNTALYVQKFNGNYPRFIKYFLEFFDLTRFSSGAAVPTLNRNSFSSELVCTPDSIDEQKRIVEKLDALLTRINTAIEHLQESVTLTDALLKSSLSSMLTKREHWERVRLNDVCQITSKLCDPREEEYLDMYHVGGANITQFSGALINLMTAREEKLISGKFPFDINMVLYSKIRPYLMKVARPVISGICSADIYPLTPEKQKMTRDFLFYLLLSEQFTQYAIEGSSRAGMPKVNRNHLFNFGFHLPPLDEQKSMCESLDALVAKTNEVSKELASKLTYLADLKASILDSAFKGEL